MEREKLKELLGRFKNNDLPEDELLRYIENLPFEDILYAKIDHHREIRWGFPEVIFCQGKTPDQITAIARAILDRGSNLLATRANLEAYGAILAVCPGAHYNAAGRTITFINHDIAPVEGKVLIVTAGTSDMPVAEEAGETAKMLGLDAELLHDIGVAGIHRVMHYRDEIASAAVVIVIAGMEGALATVIAGLVQSPVVAVPTSNGYGASFEGIAALLSMLNSCVPGVAVMNIDNGFGAAFLAYKILCTARKLAQ